MESQSISFLVAFGAGFLSFVSPCIFPLVLIYLSFLSGKNTDQDADKKTVFLHALLFVLGFSCIFVALGASVGLIGNVLIDKLPLLRIIAGILLIILGIHVIGLVKIPFLYRVKKFNIVPRGKGYPVSFLAGVSFSLGWTPCVGPILGGILTLAYASQTVLSGTLLLLVYSLGLGIPLLLCALLLGRVSKILQRLNKYHRAIEITSGSLLIFIGILIAANLLTILSF